MVVREVVEPEGCSFDACWGGCRELPWHLLVAFEMCQLAIWGVQRVMVRPNLLISGGHDSSWRSSARWRVYRSARAAGRCMSRTGSFAWQAQRTSPWGLTAAHPPVHQLGERIRSLCECLQYLPVLSLIGVGSHI